MLLSIILALALLVSPVNAEDVILERADIIAYHEVDREIRHLAHELHELETCKTEVPNISITVETAKDPIEAVQALYINVDTCELMARNAKEVAYLSMMVLVAESQRIPDERAAERESMNESITQIEFEWKHFMAEEAMFQDFKAFMVMLLIGSEQWRRSP